MAIAGAASATLTAVFRASLAPFKMGVKAARKKGKGFGKDMTKSMFKANLATAAITKTLGLLTRGLSGAVQAAKQFAISSVESFLDFDRKIGQIQVLLEDTPESKAADEIKKIEEATLSYARKFPQSATEVAEGFYDAISAGFNNAAKAAPVMDAALKLSRAAATDAKSSVSALVTTLQTFRVPAEEAESTANLLFRAIQLGRTTGQEFADTWGQIAGIASSAGLSLEETLATFTGLTKATGRTDLAITSFKNLLNQVQNGTGKAKEELKKYGIEFGVNATRNGKFLENMEKIHRLMEVQPDLVNAAFREMRAGLGLKGLKLTFGGVNDALAKMQEGTDRLTPAFNTMIDRASGRFDELKSVWENLKISMVSAFEGELTDAFQGFTLLIEEFQKVLRGDVSAEQFAENVLTIFNTKIYPALEKIWDAITVGWERVGKPIFVDKVLPFLGEKFLEFVTMMIQETIKALPAIIGAMFEGIWALMKAGWEGLVSGVGDLIGLQTGGMVPGNNPGNDKMVIRATAGEFVLRKEAVQALGLSNVQQLNAMGNDSPTPGAPSLSVSPAARLTVQQLRTQVFPAVESMVAKEQFGASRLGI